MTLVSGIQGQHWQIHQARWSPMYAASQTTLDARTGELVEHREHEPQPLFIDMGETGAEGQAWAPG